MADQLKQLAAAGQSIWLDNIRRSMFASGELRRLIDAGLRGMTSNPTIFEKAIGSGNDYDEQLRSLAGRNLDPNTLFEALAIDDIRHALDEFRPIYDATGGGDGFVSLEVSPLLAHDTAGTIAAAQRLWKAVDRPNVMIKIPATPAGIPAIAETIANGINVNVTLMFSVEHYEAAANAYIEGLERRAALGQPIDRIASVASVFVSRIDTAVDKLLEEKIAKGQTQLRSLLGKTGVANLKMTYQRFRELFGGRALCAARALRGAKPQRPLWASTGTKNPAYSDLLYVENVVARQTVNTVPPATLDALLDHGVIRPDSIEADLPGAHATLEALAQAQISLYDVTQKLQEDGVKLFADSYEAMLGAIESKTARRSRERRVDRPRRRKRRSGRSDRHACAKRFPGQTLDARSLAVVLRSATRADHRARARLARLSPARPRTHRRADRVRRRVAKVVHARGRARHGRLVARARRSAHHLRQTRRLSAIARPRFERPGAGQGHRRRDRSGAHAIHRRVQERHDDRTRGLLPLLLRTRPENGRRRKRRTAFHRDHRSRHATRSRSESQRLPPRLLKRSRHRRPLLGALLLSGWCRPRSPVTT